MRSGTRAQDRPPHPVDRRPPPHDLDYRFDLILLNGVWMHVPPSRRERAFRKLTALLKPGGHLVFGLRSHPPDDERTAHSTSTAELRNVSAPSPSNSCRTTPPTTSRRWFRRASRPSRTEETRPWRRNASRCIPPCGSAPECARRARGGRA
ncbi:MAG: hypothetical protein BRD55_03960 [Bacteroidetes bacterium SW_9_63_38]|nr:MAG: hypothetical protein BRD55_03960 [Bacteroidetes bacterium SW_9_63_38]